MDNPAAAVIQVDARQVDRILVHPDTRRLLDFNQPVAVLFVSFLHFIVDDNEAYNVVRELRDALVPGSYIALSHTVDDAVPHAIAEQSEGVYNRSHNPGKLRTQAQIARFFDGFSIVEPGLVFVPLWGPERDDDIFLDQPERSLLMAGVGRKK
jgi:hypothetical protein